MIRQLRGTITDIGPTYIVLDVGGVGYQVYTPRATNYQLETPATFHTHLAVRENALDIYGFLERDSLSVFELLIDLPKIGPKSALEIMMKADVALLREAVANGDPGYLSKVSGIGKKSAEKIVSGLKDKFEDLAFEAPGEYTSIGTFTTHHTDTIDALVSLGYPVTEARRVVLDISSAEPEANSSAIIKIALKRLYGQE